ncbi:DJ1B [Symbiodinium sp. CCMP2592]|uniref:Protein DJ-1-like B n=1 Tax=Symbiodinium microadriaticum TaxID=2951 RepID=A0A1Q9D2G8_SYMMI|nr:Protein DJ-1-like B [Symbiodinium microadriaticum]CAE7816315.1 DJ1B [Symbiodinium sp. CCMP2592]
MAKVLVPVADGSEEIETTCITDTLTRCGCQVTVASVMPGKLQVKMSRGINVVADCAIEDCKGTEWDAIALPGGMPGAEHLRDCAALTELLKDQSGKGKVTAAVCASPAVVFGTHGLLPEKSTCYPKFKDVVGAGWQDAQAVMDGHIITSQGPGTSIQFALKIGEKLCGKDKAVEVAKGMLVDYVV